LAQALVDLGRLVPLDVSLFEIRRNCRGAHCRESAGSGGREEDEMEGVRGRDAGDARGAGEGGVHIGRGSWEMRGHDRRRVWWNAQLVSYLLQPRRVLHAHVRAHELHLALQQVSLLALCAVWSLVSLSARVSDKRRVLRASCLSSCSISLSSACALCFMGWLHACWYSRSARGRNVFSCTMCVVCVYSRSLCS